MSNFKITGFSAAGALTGAELLELVQGGVNKQATLQKLVELVASKIFIPYTSGTPATPAFPTAPAVAFDPSVPAVLPTLFWNGTAWV